MLARPQNTRVRVLSCIIYALIHRNLEQTDRDEWLKQLARDLAKVPEEGENIFLVAGSG